MASALPTTGPNRLAPPAPPTTPLFQCPECGTAHAALPFFCATCKFEPTERRGYVDLTRTASSPPSLLRNLLTQPPSQSLFQLPLVSAAYERGWRANFARAGFPGIEKERDLFLDFAAPAAAVLDMSCGSGLMARRLASSGRFGRVVAADYSDAMLRQTVEYKNKDATAPEFDVVRADVARLPFVEGAFGAVHSGAALHCWPNVQDGLAEIQRVLQPGGRFFATTFSKLAYLPNRERIDRYPRLKKAVVRAEELVPGQRPYRFFEVDELEYLFKAAGFVEVDVERLKGCVIVRCRKSEE
ncbi:unnamed protein product [Chondrus crispus]|uniref:Methyltransferase type 11 domain-containing protein n=1 Tax=Chondrus crispus TaxID=2769 RepID=R7Q8V4_CHOCR|nr:unnamed protein product [Chondrus crispus]CDF33826.1 unnamed protein product [Chondrus crispus]|eukprot:XP_005713645.1 unnamed protein product [Chondrus crispus]